jgi:serine/threonine protein kinase
VESVRKNENNAARAPRVVFKMAFAAGTRLGVYEITGLIGVGGMGEVYRATDTTLARAVAIKVLPDFFSADADRTARFEREAKTLASLNHSNIGQIFGLERRDGTTAWR